MFANLATAPEGPQQESTGSKTTAVGVVGVLAILVPVGIVLYRIYPGTVPKKHDPGWIDNIFGTNLVVFAARLVLLSAGVVLAFLAAHVMWSVVRWFREGHLVTKIGPVQVSEHAVQTLEAELEFWRGQALALDEQVHALTKRIEESDDLLASLLEEDAEVDETTTLDEDDEVEEDL